MLLIHTQKLTPRIDFVFKHICNRILGLEIEFTSVIEEFIAFPGPKISYGKQPMGNELFFQSDGLLFQQGIEDLEINVKRWDETHCFFHVSEKSALEYDIFSAAFYLLCRYEEYLPHVKDEFGRFPASESLGHKEGFLQQPVIDVWAYKLKSVLSNAYPEIVFPKKKGTVHTLLRIEEPFLYSQKGFIRSLAGYVNEFRRLKLNTALRRTKVLMRFRGDPMNVYEWIVSVTKHSKNKLTAFFFLGDNPELHKGFDSKRKKFKSLLKYINDYNEVGIQFSHNALQDLDILKEEKLQIEENTHKKLRSTVFSDFLIQLPELYRNLVELEIERDFSMVYEDTAGFRAGTCTPFLFYDLDYEIKTPLVIHPIAFTTNGFNEKYESDSIQRIYDMYEVVEKLNGTFSIFFNVDDFIDDKYNAIWRNLFSQKLNRNE